jgi:hypothetical protein
MAWSIKFTSTDWPTKMSLWLTGKNTTKRSDYTGDTNYHVWSMWWWSTYDWNSIFMQWDWFFDNWWADMAWAPEAWYLHGQWLQVEHYNNGSTWYGWQMMSWSAGNWNWYLRSIWWWAFNQWYKILLADSSSRVSIWNTSIDYLPSWWNWLYTLLLNWSDNTSIWFHDAWASVSSIKYNNGWFTIWWNDWWWTKSVDMPGWATTITPTSSNWVATKAYVDAAVAAAGGGAGCFVITSLADCRAKMNTYRKMPIVVFGDVYQQTDGINCANTSYFYYYYSGAGRDLNYGNSYYTFCW